MLRSRLPGLLHWVAPVSCLFVTGTVKATVKIASRPANWDWPAALFPMPRLPVDLKFKPNWWPWPLVHPISVPVSPRLKRLRQPSACRRDPTPCRWPTMAPLQSLRHEPWPDRYSVTRYLLQGSIFFVGFHLVTHYTKVQRRR